MKKKIIVAALAAVIALNVCTVRPKAAASAAAIALTIGSAAVFLMGVFTGQYDDTASGIGSVLENGWEGFEKAFVGTDETFCGEVISSEDAWIVTGYKQICSQLTSWFEAGEISIVDDKVKITYQQYIELANILGDYVSPSWDFGYTGDYCVFDIGSSFNINLPLSGLRVYDTLYSDYGQSYIPIMYNDRELYVFDNYLWAKGNLIDFAFGDKGAMAGYNFSSSLYGKTSLTSSGANYVSPDKTYPNGGEVFLDTTLKIDYPYFLSTPNTSTSNWKFGQILQYTNDGLVGVDYNSIDSSDLSCAWVIMPGDGCDLVNAISKYAYNPGADIDDLSNTLPLDKTDNPDLVIDTDSSITHATDAVTVSNVPGVEDATLTEYMTTVDTDIDVPSIIIQKFPFCIPFDFYNIISTLCVDPVAPVIRIPISTNPDNISGFDGNQTIGNYLPDDDTEPLFDIDEEIVLDLSAIPLLQPISYTIFIVGFIVLLIMVTPKLIQH